MKKSKFTDRFHPEALPLILSGEIYIPACALRLDQGYALLAPEGLAPRTRNTAAGFTPRQREVIVMLGEGKSNKQIAREIKVLEGTVKLHVRQILHKLGVKNRTEAVLAAARGGYLSPATFGIETAMSADQEILNRTSAQETSSIR